MKKLYAFLTALCLFLVTTLFCHLYIHTPAAVQNPAFSTLPMEEKEDFLSGMTENLDEKSIPIFGSSEFQHGADTPYHPASMFTGTDFHPMLLGAGYYQSLWHAITLAAIEPSMDNKTAVLILSPQWFRKTGVVDQAFSSRFSEPVYTGMLSNERLSEETKEYISGRTHTLLANVDVKTLKHVDQHEAVLWKQNGSFSERAMESLWNLFLEEKDRFQLSANLFAAKITGRMRLTTTGQAASETSESTGATSSNYTPDWAGLLAQAETDGNQENQNEFFIDDKSYQKLKPFLPSKKDMNKDAKKGYQNSPEYDDLRCFLRVCRELGIEPMLVILPVNGYYYDFTGFPTSARQGYYEKIRAVAAEFEAEVADFSDQEYTKYFFEDRVHLGKTGWVMVNERIYEFYQKNKGSL